MERLKEVLCGQEKNAVVPFFWQHGENKEILSEYMDQIHACGCGGVCVEARPHPEFVKEKWWEDVGFIIQKAKKAQMEVWILDDSHFPTGYANGLVAEKYPQYLKTYLDCRRFDVVGPLQYARLNMRFLKGRPGSKEDRSQDTILGIYAAQRADEAATGIDVGMGARTDVRTDARMDAVLPQTFIELTDQIQDGILYWDIPEGNWSVFVMFTTRAGGEESTKDYLNPLIKEATQVLIEAVYEPHYAHFKDDFGTTITAFFSDEPRFGNAKGMDKSIGRAQMVLPWREDLDKLLPFPKQYLPFLFADSSDQTMEEVRYAYMDTITTLYAENFTQVLGSWCQEHGVKYIGHHIEDNGAHMRLGYGTGHLFRAQKGQSFSGIDVIANQIAPGYAFHHDAFATGGNDGVFYHYALARLGASIAHNDPKKQGIALCEAFGAYGWNEGLKWMKWITDHLLVRGINYFVPHAFNPKQYPDWDCAPHFYAGGHNPQFRYFHILIRYMQRMCHLLQGGIQDAAVAVLYPAEGEWISQIQPLELVLRELDTNQIGAAVVSLDDLTEQKMNQQSFSVNKNRYQCLIVPAMKTIPDQMAKKLLALCKNQVPVFFADAYPSGITGGSLELLEQLKQQASCIPLKEVADACEKWKTVRTKEKQKDLVCYHYIQPDGEVYMLFQEHPSKELKTELSIPGTQIPAVYDAFTNTLRLLSVRREKECMYVSVCLKPYESMVILLQDDWDGYPMQQAWQGTVQKKEALHGEWNVSFADAQSYTGYPDASGFTKVGTITELVPLSCKPEFADRTGILRYEHTFTWKIKDSGRVFLNLGTVYETAEVFLNGTSVGVRICPPYRVEITEALLEGKNELAIEVVNTLGNENKEFFSQYTPIEPFGLSGEVLIEEECETFGI